MAPPGHLPRERLVDLFLELLNIGPDSPLEISTDGRTLIVSPATDPKRRKRFESALKKTNRKFGRLPRSLGG